MPGSLFSICGWEFIVGNRHGRTHWIFFVLSSYLVTFTDRGASPLPHPAQSPLFPHLSPHSLARIHPFLDHLPGQVAVKWGGSWLIEGKSSSSPSSSCSEPSHGNRHGTIPYLYILILFDWPPAPWISCMLMGQLSPQRAKNRSMHSVFMKRNRAVWGAFLFFSRSLRVGACVIRKSSIAHLIWAIPKCNTAMGRGKRKSIKRRKTESIKLQTSDDARQSAPRSRTPEMQLYAVRLLNT